MSSEITLSTHLQSKARSADRQEYRRQNQTASFPISPANLSKHTSLQCFQGKSSIQLCEVWLSQWPCALPAGSPGAFLPGKLCSLTSRGWAQDGQVGWQMVAWGCSSAALTKGQECLSFPLSICTTPLFICFLIGAKSDKCWTELEVICSSSCLPELGDKVVFKRVCMFSHMSVIGPYIGNLKKDQLNVSWCKPLSTWASLHILHAGC